VIAVNRVSWLNNMFEVDNIAAADVVDVVIEFVEMIVVVVDVAVVYDP